MSAGVLCYCKTPNDDGSGSVFSVSAPLNRSKEDQESNYKLTLFIESSWPGAIAFCSRAGLMKKPKQINMLQQWTRRRRRKRWRANDTQKTRIYLSTQWLLGVGKDNLISLSPSLTRLPCTTQMIYRSSSGPVSSPSPLPLDRRK